MASVAFFTFAIFHLFFALHIKDYFSIIKNYDEKPVDSIFYQNEYIVPEYENIVFPDKKKNLVIILLESMESSFADAENGGLMQKNLIPNLTKIAKENINFSDSETLGGAPDLFGTGWTVAAMTAKFSGLPYNMIVQKNANHVSFLPNAVTLTDILAKNGYNQRFIFGSDKHFAGRDALLETHGNVEVHDIEWYKNHNMLPKNYGVFWGFEDEKLFEYAKWELSELSEQEKPFMLGLLTVDTHMPSGYICEKCPADEDMPLKNAIRCSDAQTAEFLAWCKTQDWYTDTVFAIMGDHLFMDTAQTTPFSPDTDKNARRWIDIFINATPVIFTQNIKNREFSDFDMFPTMLSALGCKIRNNRLGFGVDLFSSEPTLLERFSKEEINKQLSVRSKQYLELEFSKDKLKFEQ